jgi:hypothetical protein
MAQQPGGQSHAVSCGAIRDSGVDDVAQHGTSNPSSCFASSRGSALPLPRTGMVMRLADVLAPHGPIFLGLLLHAAAMYYCGMTYLEGHTLWFTFLVVLYRLSFGCVHTPLPTMVLKNLAGRPVKHGFGIRWGPPRPGECPRHRVWQHDSRISDLSPPDWSWCTRTTSPWGTGAIWRWWIPCKSASAKPKRFRSSGVLGSSTSIA